MTKKETDTVKKESKVQKFLIKFGLIAAALLVVFLLGFIPMWMKARTANAEHEVTKKLLVKEEIVNSLTVGLIDARRGEYEAARKDASKFFSSLTNEIDKGEESAFSEVQINKLKALFEKRDDTITMLAQRDQASVERLTDTYLKYQESIGAARPTSEEKKPNADSESNSE